DRRAEYATARGVVRSAHCLARRVERIFFVVRRLDEIGDGFGDVTMTEHVEERLRDDAARDRGIRDQPCETERTSRRNRRNERDGLAEDDASLGLRQLVG